MQPQSTMSQTGISAQNAESNRRAMETAHATLPEIVTFRAATQMQIMNALQEEEVSGTNPSVLLARQGLYDPDRKDVVFHAENILNTVMAVQTGLEESDAYKIFQRSREKLLAIIAQNPEKLYVKSGQISLN